MPAAMEGPRPDETPAARGRVLLVDDDEAVRDITTLVLRRLGLEVTAVGAGRDALEALEAGGIDLAVIDRQLPGLDGPAVVREWRRREEEMSADPVPIAMMTGDPAAERACLEAGADAFLAKPARMETLAEVVRRFLLID